MKIIDESEVFKVSLDHKESVIRFGGTNVLVVDNFYTNPDLVRELALTIPPTHRHMRDRYPGIMINASYDMSSLVDPYNNYIQTYFPNHLSTDYVCRVMDGATFLINVMQSYGLQNMPPHTDNPSRENLASSIFLNTPDECAGGTAFYEDGQMLGHVEMKYNRMIMYNQCAEHSGYLPEGSFESDLWRISQQFFI